MYRVVLFKSVFEMIIIK